MLCNKNSKSLKITWSLPIAVNEQRMSINLQKNGGKQRKRDEKNHGDIEKFFTGLFEHINIHCKRGIF